MVRQTECVQCEELLVSGEQARPNSVCTHLKGNILVSFLELWVPPPLQL